MCNNAAPNTQNTLNEYIQEVNASDSGVEAILSQSKESKMHPCVFFSGHLSPVERNYDIGDREVLAVRMALEE